MSVQDAVSLTSEIISATETLIYIGNAMNDQSDEYIVDQFSALGIQHGLKSITYTRDVINRNAGLCGATAIVANKAQVFLSILDDAERVLSSLSRQF